MSTIERRLRHDIEALDRSVVVTETDLREAQESVSRRMELHHRRNRDRTIGAAAAAALLLPALALLGWQNLHTDDASAPPVAPGPSPSVDGQGEAFLSGKEPTSERVSGVWLLQGAFLRSADTRLMALSPDGVYRETDRGTLQEAPSVLGTYDIDGGAITVSPESGSAECAGSDIQVRASLPQPDALRFLWTRPGTGGCAVEPGTTAAWQRVLPTSEALAQRQLPTGGRWVRYSSVYDIEGTYLQAGGGHLLELAPGASYYVLGGTGEVVDRGQWTLEGSTLTLASAPSSTTCDAGDRLVLADVAKRDVGGTVGFRGEPTRDDCNAGWVGDVWILLS